jgi:hypothetical protein
VTTYAGQAEVTDFTDAAGGALVRFALSARRASAW